MKTYLFSLLILIPLSIFSQNNNKDKSFTKIIPFAEYSASNFKGSIVKSFVLPDMYINAVFKDEEADFYIKSDDYRDGNKIGLNQKKIDIFSTQDSVFCLYLNSYYRPIDHIGIIRDNEIFMLRNDDLEKLYHFSEYVVLEFGSIEKFKELYLSGQQRLLDFGRNNGLTIYDKNIAIDFLERDYRVHQTYHPTDTLGTLNRFVDMIASFTLIEKGQRVKLSEALYKEIADSRTLPKRMLNTPYYDCGEEVEILDKDISVLLPLYLTKQQYLEVMRRVKIHNEQWAVYLQYIKETYPEFDKDTGNLEKLINEIPIIVN